MILVNLKTVIAATITLAPLCWATPNWAQNAEAVEEIISRGTIQQDPAMTAWNAGDFEAAEIEFGKNAMCALRAKRNFESALESARESSINSNISSDVSTTVSSSGNIPDGGNTSGLQAQATSSTRLNSNNFKNKNSNLKRTCVDRGFQLYMMGLSQLKQGKRDEAKETLVRAAKMRRSLYDAQFRLSLLEYQDGNIERAHKHYKNLQKLAPKCKDCDAAGEIKAQLSYLENLLE